MGLDMYLEAEQYVGGWDHSSDDEKKRFATIMDAVGLGGFRCDNASALDVSVRVAYWRKANAVHSWFVKNVQDGKDECQRSYVEREQLEELVKACQQVLDTVETVDGKLHTGTTFYGDGRVEKHEKEGQVVAQKELAEKLLPTQDGFFFGSTNYDEWYLNDLRDTVKQITALLNDQRFEGWDFYYRASW